MGRVSPAGVRTQTLNQFGFKSDSDLEKNNLTSLHLYYCLFYKMVTLGEVTEPTES